MAEKENKMTTGDSRYQIKPYIRKVHYYETDQMGIVHHSNYIRWMEEARTDTLTQIGLPYDQIERTGILIPVLDASCEYKLSFRYGDIFRIVVSPESFSGVKMSLNYRIYGETDGKLHAVGKTGHCFLDSGMKPLRLKRDYQEIYGNLMGFFKESAG